MYTRVFCRRGPSFKERGREAGGEGQARYGEEEQTMYGLIMIKVYQSCPAASSSDASADIDLTLKMVPRPVAIYIMTSMIFLFFYKP
jgi:hypothetical protein